MTEFRKSDHQKEWEFRKIDQIRYQEFCILGHQKDEKEVS